jgi:PAS domain S-box-containing protein
MHPTLRKQLQATLGQSSPHKARLESLVAAVHRQYERHDKELMALEKRLAHLEGRQAAAGPAMEGEDGLRVLLDNIKDGIVSVDAAGRIRSVNSTAERMFGRDAAHLIGEHLRALLVMPDTISTTDHLAELSRVHDDTQLDLAATRGVGRRADGRQFPVDILAACADERDGHKIYVLAIRDMSDNIEAERALRESEARYRSLVDSAPEAIVVLDPGAIRRWHWLPPTSLKLSAGAKKTRQWARPWSPFLRQM